MPVYPPPPPIRLDQGGNDFLGGAMSLVNMLESQREAEQLRQLRDQQNQRAQAQEAREAAAFPVLQRGRVAQTKAAELTLQDTEEELARQAVERQARHNILSDDLAMATKESALVVDKFMKQGGPRTPEEAEQFEEARIALEDLKLVTPAALEAAAAGLEGGGVDLTVLPETLAKRVRSREIRSDPERAAKLDAARVSAEAARVQLRQARAELGRYEATTQGLIRGEVPPEEVWKRKKELLAEIGKSRTSSDAAEKMFVSYRNGLMQNQMTTSIGRDLKKLMDAERAANNGVVTDDFWNDPEVLAIDPELARLHRERMVRRRELTNLRGSLESIEAGFYTNLSKATGGKDGNAPPPDGGQKEIAFEKIKADFSGVPPKEALAKAFDTLVGSPNPDEARVAARAMLAGAGLPTSLAELNEWMNGSDAASIMLPMSSDKMRGFGANMRKLLEELDGTGPVQGLGEVGALAGVAEGARSAASGAVSGLLDIAQFAASEQEGMYRGLFGGGQTRNPFRDY